MNTDPIDRLLDRLPAESAVRAAMWLIWSVIARRILLALAPLAVALGLHPL